jgi:hypothetical protein
VLFLCMLAYALALARPARAAEFTCSDVACLIDRIHQANDNGQQNTIYPQPGTYSLTAIANTIKRQIGTYQDVRSANGLPSVTSPLTI